MMLRAHSWLGAQGSFLIALREPYVVSGIEPEFNWPLARTQLCVVLCGISCKDDLKKPTKFWRNYIKMKYRLLILVESVINNTKWKEPSPILLAEKVLRTLLSCKEVHLWKKKTGSRAMIVSKLYFKITMKQLLHWPLFFFIDELMSIEIILCVTSH